MEEREQGPKKARKPRPRLSAAGYETLRRVVARQLREWLEAGELSTADLLKAMNMDLPEPGKTKPPQGDWVMSVEGME